MEQAAHSASSANTPSIPPSAPPPAPPGEPHAGERKIRLFVLGSVVLALIVLTNLAVLLSWARNPSRNIEPPPPAVEEFELSEKDLAQVTELESSSGRRSEWTFEVLNATGVEGKEAQAAGKLESLGYRVVKIGKSDTISEVSQLFVLPDKLTKADLLLEELKGVFGVTSVAGALSDSPASARIVLGKDYVK